MDTIFQFLDYGFPILAVPRFLSPVFSSYLDSTINLTPYKSISFITFPNASFIHLQLPVYLTVIASLCLLCRFLDILGTIRLENIFFEIKFYKHNRNQLFLIAKPLPHQRKTFRHYLNAFQLVVKQTTSAAHRGCPSAEKAPEILRYRLDNDFISELMRSPLVLRGSTATVCTNDDVASYSSNMGGDV